MNALPPPPAAKREFSFPEHRSCRLPNGLTLLVVEDFRQPMVVLDLMLDAGSIRHSPASAGLSSIAARLLSQGTEHYSAQEMARSLDLIAAGLAAHAARDAFYVSMQTLQPALPLAVRLLAETLLRPLFEPEEMQRVILNQTSSLQIHYADAEFLAAAAATRLLFGAHSYGTPADGHPASLARMSAEEVRRFYSAHSRPENACLIFSGAIGFAEALRLAEDNLGAWTGGRSPGAPTPPSPDGPGQRVLLIDVPHAVQTQIVIGQRCIARRDPDHLPLVLANQVFGAGFNSRLNLRLRAREGLTYGARSVLQMDRLGGSFQISTFTQTGKSAQAVGIILELLQEFVHGPITARELEDAKAYVIGSFPIHNETPGQVADRLLSSALHELPEDYWHTYRQKLEEITLEEISSVIRKHIRPEHCSIVAAGEASAIRSSMRDFGEGVLLAASRFDPTREDLFLSADPHPEPGMSYH